MEKILILLTHTYPYAPPSEQFLHDEIRVLKDYFDLIIVVPTSHSSWVEESNKINSKNIIVTRIKRNKIIIEIFKTFPNSILLNINFYRELFGLVNRSVLLNITAIKTLLITLINKKIISKYVLNNIISQNVNKNSHVIIYSYWLSYLSNASIEIKGKLINKDYKNVRAISRAHGSNDVYLGNAMNDYKPGLMDLKYKLDKIYSISFLGKSYLEKIGFDSRQIVVSRLGVIDNGLKLPKVKKDEFVIVSCSNLIKIKRVELIVEALSEIKEYNIHWIHFGDGPERQSIEKRSLEYLNANIRFDLMGRVKNYDILESYKSTSPDLFINVSSIEGIPVSIMEAISYGIPVIATNVGGTSEVCIDRYNGILLNEDFKIFELVNSIRYFIEMPLDVYRNYCKNARKVYEEKYNAELNYRQFALDITTELKE